MKNGVCVGGGDYLGVLPGEGQLADSWKTGPYRVVFSLVNSQGLPLGQAVLGDFFVVLRDADSHFQSSQEP